MPSHGVSMWVPGAVTVKYHCDLSTDSQEEMGSLYPSSRVQYVEQENRCGCGGSLTGNTRQLGSQVCPLQGQIHWVLCEHPQSPSSWVQRFTPVAPATEKATAGFL